MYKITKEIGTMLTQAKSGKIGYVGPFEWVNGDAEFFVYEDKKLPATERLEEYIPQVEGYWLCRRSELKHPEGPVELRRMTIDPFCTNEDELIDIREACIEGIPPIDRLTCKYITSFSRLLELEPKLRQVFK